MAKSVIVALGFVLTALCLTGDTLAEPRHWKIGHVRSSGSAVHRDLQQLVERIRTGTNGAVHIDIYPGNRLGDYTVVQERVAFGEVDMFLGPFGTGVDKRLALAFTPFLVSTWPEARRIYSRDSLLFQEMGAFLEGRNIKLLGGWPVYFGGIALTQPPPNPGNPNAPKDMIIRVPPIRSFELTARALGYKPYPITWTYAKLGLRTGMVAGLLGGGAEGYLNLGETVRFYLPVQDHFEYWFLYMNLELWKGLSETEKSVIAEAAQEMELRRYAEAEAEELASLAALSASGVEIIPITDADRSRMREKTRAVVWPEMRKDIGEAFDRIVGEAANP